MTGRQWLILLLAVLVAGFSILYYYHPNYAKVAALLVALVFAGVVIMVKLAEYEFRHSYPRKEGK